MSEQEMLVLSTRDRDRLKVLHEVKEGHLTQRKAAEQLKVTDRWVRQLLGRVQQEGDRGVVHRLRGRTSPRRLGKRKRGKILQLVKPSTATLGRRWRPSIWRRRTGSRSARRVYGSC